MNTCGFASPTVRGSSARDTRIVQRLISVFNEIDTARSALRFQRDDLFAADMIRRRRATPAIRTRRRSRVPL